MLEHGLDPLAVAAVGEHEGRRTAHEPGVARHHLEAGADVRCEIETVLESYERRHPTYDPGWVDPVFEMMDATLNNLSHRTQWLKADLDRGQAEEDPVVDDDAFYAMLAEKQVG